MAFSNNLRLLAISYYSLIIIICFNFGGIFVNGLNINGKSYDRSTESKHCSRECESDFCSMPPFLRYGKYCGLLYGGCSGEKPCDGLDVCCMEHDACIRSKGEAYLSQECNKNLIKCMDSFEANGAHTFKGSTCKAKDVIDVIKLVMKAALLAGDVFDKP